jgi:hypothetical protein
MREPVAQGGQLLPPGRDLHGRVGMLGLQRPQAQLQPLGHPHGGLAPLLTFVQQLMHARARLREQRAHGPPGVALQRQLLPVHLVLRQLLAQAGEALQQGIRAGARPRSVAGTVPRGPQHRHGSL